MDTGETDWSNVDAGGAKRVDTSGGVQRQESSSMMDNQSESVYDGSNLGGDDDYMSSLGLYDGYDSYNDSGGTTEEDERYDTKFVAPSFAQTSKAAALQKKDFGFLIGKEGMATCEQCGSVGVRHAFYSKSKRFCSLSCSRSFATAQREGKSDILTKKGKPSAGGRKSKAQNQPKSAIKQETKEFDWGTYITNNMAPAAPVTCFTHVPMSDSWDQIGVGMRVEVANTDCDLPYPVFWIASVTKIAGFMAQMRYEGFGNDASHDFWVNLVSLDVHPVGWCATIGKPLVPPQSIQNKYSDWKDFLVKRLTGSRTLPGDFHQMFQDGINNHKFRPGMKLEVVNKIGMSTMKVGVICEVVGGRLKLSYIDSKDEGDVFWCHLKSPLIHHVGWSQTVGHSLEASREYRNSCLSKVTTQKFSDQDVTPEMMTKMKDIPHNMSFSVGMKLEAIDPLNLSSICVATVMKVLRGGYLMLSIDGSPLMDSGSDWFCYHATSPSIFPVGFCEINNIELTPPKGHKGPFKWFDYLKHTRSVAAPVKLFDKDIPKHGFRPGQKMEAVDLMDPRLICVATVTRIVGRLLRIHFDGWENEYDQWVDCQSPDIYPVGWCQAMKYPLEGPRIKENANPVVAMTQKKKKARNQVYKGPRKKRKSKPVVGGGNNSNPFPPGYRFLSSSSQPVDSKDKAWSVAPTAASKGGDLVRPPPHVPLPPEAVAANLPPLADPDLPEASKRAKTEEGAMSSFSKESPMDVSTPVTPTHSQSIPSDTLPTLSPKGGNVPDGKTTSHLPLGGQGSSGGGGDWTPAAAGDTNKSVVAGTADSLNNNNSNSAPLSQQRLSNGGLSSSVDSSQKSGVQGESKPSIASSSSSSSLLFTPSLQKRAPQQWSAQDVCLFLSVNDCGACSEAVLRRNINGGALLSLSAEEEISLAGTKVGPSLRITQLLQQLRSYVSSHSASSPPPSAAVPAAMETD